MPADPFTHTAGFGGLCAVVASVIAFGAAWVTTRQRRRADDAVLDEIQRRRDLDSRTAEVQRIWDRYVWLIDRADVFENDLVTLLLGRLTDAADALSDHDLVAFARQLMDTMFVDDGG